jgi:hypothetical protein
MSLNTRPGRVIAANDTPDSGADALGPGIAISQDEIDDIALDDTRPIEDRIERLRELRDRVASAAASQLEEDDTADITAEIDGMIEALSREADYTGELDDLSALDGVTMVDPNDRLDTLPPDDEDGRHRIEDGDDEGEEPDEEAVR